MTEPPPKIKAPANHNYWTIERATKASIIIDAEAYFVAARAAMLKAKHRIMLIGWDFDARISFGRGAEDGGPESVGDFIHWLVEQTPTLRNLPIALEYGSAEDPWAGQHDFLPD